MYSRFSHPSSVRARTADHPILFFALELLLYAILTAFALRSTWLTWPDAFIDFSRELYLPWRVSCGDVLYRDLAYYFGPLSVYANAALFVLVGRPSIHALFALNFAFWLSILIALRALLRRIARPAAATGCICLFILLFSFNRYLGVGNFNFLAPYSHELPRGFLFALLSLLSLDSGLKKTSCKFACLSGFLLGLVLFTKPEIALATVAAATVLFCFSIFTSRHSSLVTRDSLPTRHLSLLLCGGGGVLAAIVLVVTPLSFALGSFSLAFRHALLKLYLDCFNSDLTSLPFFKTVMGTDDIPAHVFRLLLGGVLGATPFLLVRVALPRIASMSLRLTATILLAIAATAIGFSAFVHLNAALPLAPVLFATFSLPKRKCTDKSGDSGTTDHYPPTTATNHFNSPLALAFAAFSFVLVSKILLDAHIWHYGFVLALPSFCCAVFLAFLPSRSASRAAVASALLFGFSAAALRMHLATVRNLDIAHPVMDNAFLAPRVQANAFNATLDWIRVNTAPGSSLAVFPEGAVLNVLSGRPNPTPYVSLPPTDWPRYDESAVLAAYSNSPPDTLVLVRKLEPGQFGTDYAQSLMVLLDSLYAPALTLAFTTPSGPVPYLLVATRIPPP